MLRISWAAVATSSGFRYDPSMSITALATLPRERSEYPPIVLVHGAANSASVWVFWQRELAQRGWASYAVNLRGHGGDDDTDVSHATMDDYADDVGAFVGELSRPPVLLGWSMGGLVAMIGSTSGASRACIGLAPSVPADRVDASVELRRGVYTSEVYGITSSDPQHQPEMPDLDLEERTIALGSLCGESLLARDERQRGIVIRTLPCPLLIITGTEDRQAPRSRYSDMSLKSDQLSVERASHWGLVLSRRSVASAVPRVIDWIVLNS